MAYQRGDVVLIHFPFTDLSAAKTRPAIVVSSDLYHHSRSELLLAYVSSQVTKAQPPLDYRLADWSLAGLPKPSFVRPKLAAVEAALVVYQVGRLTAQDLFELDRCLRKALALTETVLRDVLNDLDLAAQPADVVQSLAEKSVTAAMFLAATHASTINIERLRNLLTP